MQTKRLLIGVCSIVVLLIGSLFLSSGFILQHESVPSASASEIAQSALQRQYADFDSRIAADSFPADAQVSPEELFLTVWRQTARNIYDPSELRDWSRWPKLLARQLKTEQQALDSINMMLDSVPGYYHELRVKPIPQTGQPNVDVVGVDLSGSFIAGVGIRFENQRDAFGHRAVNNQAEFVPATNQEGFPIIESLEPDSPAITAGMVKGDVVLSIDGITSQGRSIDALLTQLAGASGDTVEIIVARGQAHLNLSIVRGREKVPLAHSQLLNGGIGYIRLDVFDGWDDLVNAMDKLRNAHALIIDLRLNPGGEVMSAIESASLFMQEGTIVTLKERIPGNPNNPTYDTTNYKATSNQIIALKADGSSTAIARLPYLLAGRPVVILTSAQTASASEMFTAALHDNHIAIVFGEKTFGKGVGGTIMNMPNGTQLWLITLHYLTPAGKWLGSALPGEHFGIEPDRTVAPSAQVTTVGSTNDNQLWEAWSFLTIRSF